MAGWIRSRGSRLGATHTEDMLSIGKSDYTLIEDNYLIDGTARADAASSSRGHRPYHHPRQRGDPYGPMRDRRRQCDHTLVEDNRADTNLIDLGLTTGGNIGIYVWRSSDGSDNCFSNTVQRNMSAIGSPTGSTMT